MTRKQIHKAMKRAAALVLCAVLLYACVPVSMAAVDMDSADEILRRLGFVVSTDYDPYEIVKDEHVTYKAEGVVNVYAEDGQYVSYHNGMLSWRYYNYYVQLGTESYNEGEMETNENQRVELYVTVWNTDDMTQINGTYWPSDYNVHFTGRAFNSKGNIVYGGAYLKMKGSDLGIYNIPEEPIYDYWLPNYLSYMDRIGENVMPGETDPRREYSIIETPGAIREQNIVNTIIAHYGNRYPYYYYANQYSKGDYIVLSRGAMSISKYGYYIIDELTNEPYYVIRQNRDNLILRVNENTITEYGTYTDNPDNQLKLAVPADGERLAKHVPVYFDGGVLAGASFKAISEETLAAWGINKEFTQWPLYEDAIKNAHDPDNPPVDPSPEPSPEISPEPSPSPTPDGPGDEAAEEIEDIANQEYDLGWEGDRAFWLLGFGMMFFGQGTIGIGISIVVGAVVIAALIRKGKN